MKNSNIMGDSLKNIFLVRGEGGGGGGFQKKKKWGVSIKPTYRENCLWKERGLGQFPDLSGEGLSKKEGGGV